MQTAVKFDCLSRCVAALAAAMLFAATAAAELSLPAMFTDGAVLQQGKPVPVWGTADAGAEVTVSFGDQTKTATAAADGKFMVKLDSLEASKEPAVLTVKSGSDEATVKNVLVGEVWFCSGQSNMEWTVNRSIMPDSIDPDKLPMIRHIKVPHVRANEPAADFNGAWQVCDKQTVGGFTAVGFYFAQQLNKELDTPIGLIGCNWGGTRIEPWIAPEGYAMTEELKDMKLGDQSTMYNGMVCAVKPYAIAGSIWYQGESNGGEGESYLWKTKALVEGWRKVWGQDDFPYYLVQLANFRKPNPEPAGGDGWARIREAQTNVLKTVKNTGMAVIIDIGEANDIHPKNKFDVGCRLARWALAKDYGKTDLVYSGPLYKDAKVEGDKIRVSFDHVGSGLMAAKKESPQSLDPPQPVEKLAGFAIAGEDQKWVWADAVIEGDTVVVSSPEVKQPVAVRYGFSMNPDTVNLYNKEGLPAGPFRTDTWEK
jgi:sialate O-acetylesterase